MGTSVSIVFSLITAPLSSYAATTTTTYMRPTVPDVFVTELQTGTQTSSGQEFIEFYNNTDHEIDFADTAHGGKDAWKLQYYPASKLAGLSTQTNWTSPYRTINLTGAIEPHNYYMAAASGYAPGSLEPDQTYSATFSDDGGAVQLIDAATVSSVTIVGIHDQLAWSNDKTLPSSKLRFSAPGLTATLQRLPNDNGSYINTDNTLTSFIVDSRPTPDDVWAAPLPVTEEPDNPPVGTPPLPINANKELVAPILTEVLPNPAVPQTDESDEYIELYNPNDQPFALRGYSLETG